MRTQSMHNTVQCGLRVCAEPCVGVLGTGIDDDEPEAPAPFLFDPTLEESDDAAADATPMSTDT